MSSESQRWYRGWLLLCTILVATVVIAALCSCTAGYENENGPRGPEKLGMRAVWPWTVCNEAPAASD